MGEARLMNQFGKNGVILRNIMYHIMSLWCLAAWSHWEKRERGESVRERGGRGEGEGRECEEGQKNFWAVW